MENTQQIAGKLWNRNFSLLVIGQIISIFGNMVLNFVLPLYVLYISGSPALFGVVVGLPFLSLLITSPIGGMMADRLRKQRILFWLDATMTVLIVLYMIISGLMASVVPIVIVKLLALNAIQGLYMPAADASIPLLVPSDKLVPANSAIISVNSLANLAAPAVAGILFDRFGLFPILLVSAVCFGATAIMDLLIRIPYKKQEASENMLQMVKSDMSQALRFMVKESPILARLMVILLLLTLVAGGIILVGLPVLITQNLGMSMEDAGFSKGITASGILIGSMLAASLGDRLTIRKAYLPLLGCVMTLIPIGAVFLFDTSTFVAYVVITASATLTFTIMQLVTIPMMVHVQKETPTELLGKVMSLIPVLPFVANGIGLVLFGVLFELFYTEPWIVIFTAAVIGIIVALYSRRYLNIES